MRLWHKDLIPVLPRKQLVSQWRECCAIAGEINKYGSPRSPLTKKIMNYPIGHFKAYTLLVKIEMKKRGYKYNAEKFKKQFNGPNIHWCVNRDELFKNWHNDRYLKQCYYNLQEKYDCGMITEEEFGKINDYVNDKIFIL